MTVTSRFFDEKTPLAKRRVPCPYPDPPAGRTPIGRLCFHGPSPKIEFSIPDLVRIFGATLQDAIFFPDTNVFTKRVDEELWDALRARRIFIVPGVWKELLPWLKTPFCNRTMRDAVVAAIQRQVSSRGKPQESTAPGIEVLLLEEDFRQHGYDYYVKLLALRKAFGPLTNAVLTKTLGRAPTCGEFHGEVQGKFGERGLLMARKGIEAATSPNKLTDEQLVVAAVMTSIMRGSEVIILTRDADVLEQYFKLLVLMKEHYRAMLAAENYAANPTVMAFRKVPVQNDGVHIPEFSGTSVLEFETTDLDFNPLPRKFHAVNIYCFLLGSESPDMKISSCVFCAETEMAQTLRLKASSGGLNTDKFGCRNCIIHTTRNTTENARLVLSIGEETSLSFGPFGKIGINDLQNTLFANEMCTHLTYADPS